MHRQARLVSACPKRAGQVQRGAARGCVQLCISAELQQSGIQCKTHRCCARVVSAYLKEHTGAKGLHWVLCSCASLLNYSRAIYSAKPIRVIAQASKACFCLSQKSRSGAKVLHWVLCSCASVLVYRRAVYSAKPIGVIAQTSKACFCLSQKSRTGAKGGCTGLCAVVHQC